MNHMLEVRQYDSDDSPSLSPCVVSHPNCPGRHGCKRHRASVFSRTRLASSRLRRSSRATYVSAVAPPLCTPSKMLRTSALSGCWSSCCARMRAVLNLSSRAVLGARASQARSAGSAHSRTRPSPAGRTRVGLCRSSGSSVGWRGFGSKCVRASRRAVYTEVTPLAFARSERASERRRRKHTHMPFDVTGM